MASTVGANGTKGNEGRSPGESGHFCLPRSVWQTFSCYM